MASEELRSKEMPRNPRVDLGAVGSMHRVLLGARHHGDSLLFRLGVTKEVIIVYVSVKDSTGESLLKDSLGECYFVKKQEHHVAVEQLCVKIIENCRDAVQRCRNKV